MSFSAGREPVRPALGRKHVKRVLLRREVVRDALVHGPAAHVDDDLLLHAGLRRRGRTSHRRRILTGRRHDPKGAPESAACLDPACAGSLCSERRLTVPEPRPDDARPSRRRRPTATFIALGDAVDSSWTRATSCAPGVLVGLGRARAPGPAQRVAHLPGASADAARPRSCRPFCGDTTRRPWLCCFSGSAVFLGGVILVGVLESHRTAGAAYRDPASRRRDPRRTAGNPRPAPSGRPPPGARRRPINRLAETIDAERRRAS